MHLTTHHFFLEDLLNAHHQHLGIRSAEFAVEFLRQVVDVGQHFAHLFHIIGLAPHPNVAQILGLIPGQFLPATIAPRGGKQVHGRPAPDRVREAQGSRGGVERVPVEGYCLF